MRERTTSGPRKEPDREHVQWEDPFSGDTLNPGLKVTLHTENVDMYKPVISLGSQFLSSSPTRATESGN